MIRNTPGQGRRRRERGAWPVINSNTVTPSPHHSLSIPSSVSNLQLQRPGGGRAGRGGEGALLCPLPLYLLCLVLPQEPPPLPIRWGSQDGGEVSVSTNHTFPSSQAPAPGLASSLLGCLGPGPCPLWTKGMKLRTSSLQT